MAGSLGLSISLLEGSSDLFGGISLDRNLGDLDLSLLGATLLESSISSKERAVPHSEGILPRGAIAIEDSLEIGLSEAVVVLGDFVEQLSGIHGL